jgi:aminoglycoside 3-N-acetyltransferase
LQEKYKEKFIELIAEKTKNNPAFIHLDMLGLTKLGRNNIDRLNEFCDLLEEIEKKKGNICIPTYSFSYTKNEDYNILKTPCVNVGTVSEHVRKRHPEKRTVDAIFSYIIYGDKISGNHFEVSDYETFGEGSIMEEVFNLDGYIWAIGGVFKNSTEIHFIEKMLQISYRYDKIFSGQIIDKEGKAHEQQITYFCKNFDYNLWYDFKNLENDLRDDGLIETFKSEGYPFFISGIKFRTLYDYVEQKIKKDSNYFLKDLKDKRL